MFRAIRRWFTDSEVQALAGDVDVMQARVLDWAHRIEGLQRRIDRYLDKMGARDARAQRRGGGATTELELSPEEEGFLMDLRRNGESGRDPFGH